MSYVTGMDMDAICAYCGKRKMLCDCNSTVKGDEIVHDRIIRIYPVE